MTKLMFLEPIFTEMQLQESAQPNLNGKYRVLSPKFIQINGVDWAGKSESKISEDNEKMGMKEKNYTVSQ